MTKKQPAQSSNARPGDFQRMRLADGTFGYARLLADLDVAFYDLRTETPLDSLDEIEARQVVFTIGVHKSALSRWEGIGWRPLSGELARPVVKFMQKLDDYRKCFIFDSAGMERAAEPEECVGLERAAAWEPHGAEARLLDHFLGRENPTEVHNRVRLEPGVSEKVSDMVASGFFDNPRKP